jgi:hypothetical protein
MDAALLSIPPHARATVQAILDEARRLSPDGVSYDASVLIARFGDLKRAQAQRAGTLGQFENIDWGSIGSAVLPAVIGVGSNWANSAINAHAAGSTSNVDMNAIAAMMASPPAAAAPVAAPPAAPTYIVAPAAPAKDYTPWYIGGGLGALALIGGAFALAMGGGGRRLRRNPSIDWLDEVKGPVVYGYVAGGRHTKGSLIVLDEDGNTEINSEWCTVLDAVTSRRDAVRAARSWERAR